MPEKARAQVGCRSNTLEVERLMLAFPVLPLTGPVVLEAPRGVEEHMLPYFYAQIWAVARLGQVGLVLR